MAFPRARDGHVDFGLRGRFGVCGIWDSLGFAVTGTGLAIVEPKPRRKRAPKLLEAPGAKPLANVMHERYARLRSLLRPKADAYRQAFEIDPDGDYDHHAARGNASKVERRDDVQARIAFLTRQPEEVLAAKRQRLEEMLWLIHEANVADMWEMVEVPKLDKQGKEILGEDGEPLMKWVQRPKKIGEMPEDVQRAVEAITINEAGFVIPKPYSKLQANMELRKLLGIGSIAREDGELRLSDAELVAELARQARELGIEIDLSYRFSG